MGRYIQWSDVVGRYQDVAKIGGDTIVNASFLPYAEDEVDSRLAIAYTVPFSTVPGVVKDLCIDLTYYKMIWRQKDAEILKKSIDERFAAISSGNLSLVASGTVLTNNLSGNVFSTTQDFPATFGMDDVLNWKVSSAQQLAAEDARYE